jgi:hypothetical protein
MNGTNSTDEFAEYGGIAYFVLHLSQYLPDTIICLVGTVFGILGLNISEAKYFAYS